MEKKKTNYRASTQTQQPTPTDQVGRGLGAEIKIRCSHKFKNSFKAKADELNLSMSELVRKAYLRIDSKIEKKVVHKADPILIREIAKIGNNLNQIARSLNQGSDFSLDALATLKSIEQELSELKNGNF